MVMEVPDTPEKAAFARPVGESSSHTQGIEGKPSSSNQYLEPMTRNYSRQRKHSGLYDYSNDNAAQGDGDFLSSQARIDRLISDPHGTRTTHSNDCYPQPMRRGVLNDCGTSHEMIDLSQESPLPLSHPTRHWGVRHNEENHLNRQIEKNEWSGYDKLYFNDFNGDNAASVEDDFLLSQARLSQSISGNHDIIATHSHHSSLETNQSNVLNSGTSPEMIDLSQGSTFYFSHPTRHRGPRHKEDKCLSRQSERNEFGGYGKLAVRSLISNEGLGKERSNASNTSKSFCSSNNISGAENIRCHARVAPSYKEKTIGQQLNSQTRNEKLHSRHPELSFPQSNLQQNRLTNGCISPRDLTDSGDNSQAKADCKVIQNRANQKAHSSFVRNQGTEIDNGSCMVSQTTIEQANHNHLDAVLHPKKNDHRMLVRNGFISPSNIARNKNDTNDKGIEEGVVIASKLYNNNSSQITKNKGHRTVVHNGGIISSNIVRNNNDAKPKGFEGGVISSKMPNGNSSKFIHGSSFEGRATDKRKGKEIINEDLLVNSQHKWTIPTSRRSCLIPEKELTIISEMDYDTGRRIDDCGAKQKHTGTSSLLSSSYATGIFSSENMPSHLSSSTVEMSKGGTRYALSVPDKPEEAILQSGENATQVQEYFKLGSEAPQHTGKRKNSFTHSNAAECSSSTVDSSRKSYDRRSAKPSYSRSIRSRKSERVDTALAPIVEIDELTSIVSEENQELSDESFAKSIQLESDEVLARQLQEQFYLESPPVGITEEVFLHTSLRRENQSNRREAMLPSLLGRSRFHHQFRRMTSEPRTENGIGHIRRNFSRPSMSMEERIDFLEALEAAFENADDMDTPDRFLGIQRDFDENDYEMLLALDDNNHHVGASERQINNLPESLILLQNSDLHETCAVCLETPSVGDTIRHLPCLHKFHKDCIDTWLRRKRSCPICKCGIT